ncbi:MAG: hypothetical protein ACKVX7_15575 [Planctomycetota bacterium]
MRDFVQKAQSFEENPEGEFFGYNSAANAGALRERRVVSTLSSCKDERRLVHRWTASVSRGEDAGTQVADYWLAQAWVSRKSVDVVTSNNFTGVDSRSIADKSRYRAKNQ